MIMKNFLFIALFLFSLQMTSQNDYKIEINDTILEIALDKQYDILINGKKIKFKVSSKDTLVYDNGTYSFKYPKDFKVSKMNIDEGIDQIMLMTAEGSGVLIQRYSTINPTMLNGMMLNEVTKESLNYGYQMKKENHSKILKSGQEIKIEKAILTYKDEVNIYEIASIGKKDEGILIMTMMMDDEMSSQGKKLIKMLWNSLYYK